MGPLVLWDVLCHGTFSAMGHLVACDVFSDVGRLVMGRFGKWDVLSCGTFSDGRFSDGTF
jgi:hypothetical protein